ncbi:MAG: hypothetical protein U0441_29320 [Polyangiaceae bacterium]
MRRFLPCFALLAPFLFSSIASAVQLPVGASPANGPAPESGALIAPPGAPALRHQATVRYGAPPPALTAAFDAFVADSGGRPWTALWDTGTNRPIRLFGGSIPAPGSSSSPAAAEKHATSILARHADLLLAGRSLADFDLVTDDESRGLRTVAYQQTAHVGAARVPVVGAVVSLRFKADRLFVLGSDALPVGAFPPAQLDADGAQTAALLYLSPAQPFAKTTSATLAVLPLIQGSATDPTSQRPGRVRVVPVWQVETESASPESRTTVFVDARSGEVVATRERLRFLTGGLQYTAPVRGPQMHADYPAENANLKSDSASFTTDGAGQYTVDPDPASLSCFPVGPRVVVISATTGAEYSFTPADGAVTTWSAPDDELVDAQLSGFVHATIAKENARKIDPSMAFLDSQLQVRVNQEDANYVCNAFWNGLSLNFFKKWQSCHNTARVADVVYHEFGHAFHTHTALASVGEFDAALGEGGADYFATTITNDPTIAPGFYTSGNYLREIDTDRRWPEDISWDPHETGLIFASAMWDLRAAFEESLGADAGPPAAHNLYRAALRGAQNIPATYPEILAEDDDDGDLGNGTPHICEILKALVPHGLSPYVTPRGGTIVHDPVKNLPGQKDPYEFKVQFEEAFSQCPADDGIASIDIHWHTLAAMGDVSMKKDGDTFIGEVPGQPVGGQLRYSLTVKGAGGKVQIPQNVADPEYRAFIGDPIPILCDDFEAGPGDYTFGEASGKVTDFAWGTPSGRGGDPPSAYSGSHVIGTMLQNDGLYRKQRTSFAEHPPVDVGDYKHVRLQLMRWLTVEDGAFDQATILVNGQKVWQNAGTDPNDGTLTHQDLEWRFEDIDLSNFTAGGVHEIKVRFELAADEAAQFGGWNLDDVCLVAWEQPPPTTSTGGAGGEGGGGAGGGGAGGETKNTNCSCRAAGAPGEPAWLAGGALSMLVALASRRRRRRT